MKKIIYQKNLHKTWLSRYQVSCIFILLKNKTTQHTLHAHARMCPSKTTTSSSLHATSLAHHVILEDNVRVTIAGAPLEENILPRHVALIGFALKVFWAFFFLCVFVIERVVVSNDARGSWVFNVIIWKRIERKSGELVEVSIWETKWI